MTTFEQIEQRIEEATENLDELRTRVEEFVLEAYDEDADPVDVTARDAAIAIGLLNAAVEVVKGLEEQGAPIFLPRVLDDEVMVAVLANAQLVHRQMVDDLKWIIGRLDAIKKDPDDG